MRCEGCGRVLGCVGEGVRMSVVKVWGEGVWDEGVRDEE